MENNGSFLFRVWQRGTVLTLRWLWPLLESFQYKPTSESTSGLHVRGISNAGNTCYVASLLQALSSCGAFVSHLERNRLSPHRTPFTHHLLTALTSVRGATHWQPWPVSIRSLLGLIQGLDGGMRFERGEQHDPLELLSTIVGLLEEEEGEGLGVQAARGQSSGGLGRAPLLLADADGSNSGGGGGGSHGSKSAECPLEGLCSSHVRCQTCCASKPTRHETFSCLSLAIPDGDEDEDDDDDDDDEKGEGEEGADRKEGRGRTEDGAPSLLEFGRATLYTCLGRHCREETLPEVECMACSIRAAQHQLSERLRMTAQSPRLAAATSQQAAAADAAVHQQLQTALLTGDADPVYCPDVPECERILENDIVISRVTSTMQRTLSISRLPQVLCLHLQRRAFLPSGVFRKIHTHVPFSSVLRFAQSSAHGQVTFTPMPTFPSSSASSSSSSTRPEAVVATYSLKAVIVHHGGERGGHYTAYCRVTLSNQAEASRRGPVWVDFNDGQCRVVKDEEVMCSCAYMLLYIKDHKARDVFNVQV